MSNRFAIALALGFLAGSFPTLASGEPITIEEFLLGETDSATTAERAADENPLVAVCREAASDVLPTPTAEDRNSIVYVVVAGSRTGDVVCNVVCEQDATVGSVLAKAIYPQPIDFAAVKIAVHRLRQGVDDDLAVKANEEILRVQWDEKTGQPTEKTDHKLRPGDRLTVTLPRDAVPGPRPTPVSASTFYGPPPVPVTSAVPPAVVAAPPRYMPDAKAVVHYSAVPAAVPSPYTKPDVPRAIAPNFGGVTPTIIAEPDSAAPSMVRFDVLVVEDMTNSLAEFDELRSQMPFMLTDTATIEGTLRILEKHKLVRRISDPQLMAVAGERATVKIGSASPESDKPWQGLATEMKAHEMGGRLAVEFGYKQSIGQLTVAVQTSLIVPNGQTVIMKTGSHLAEATKIEEGAKNETEHPVYVVLTPEIVK